MKQLKNFKVAVLCIFFVVAPVSGLQKRLSRGWIPAFWRFCGPEVKKNYCSIVFFRTFASVYFDAKIIYSIKHQLFNKKVIIEI